MPIRAIKVYIFYNLLLTIVYIRFYNKGGYYLRIFLADATHSAIIVTSG